MWQMRRKKSEQERKDGVHILTTREEEEKGVHRLTREAEEKYWLVLNVTILERKKKVVFT